MAMTTETSDPTTGATLQEMARRHLWLHFSRMGGFDDDHEVPILVRGEGC